VIALKSWHQGMFYVNQYIITTTSTFIKSTHTRISGFNLLSSKPLQDKVLH